ncbi:MULTISPECIES: dipeptide epimerase [Rufibacter]|uniref:Dipeptide epimerase n=1 Tax=Rufibacter quisquiliarum TaxID=1549639 RepID=A0A839GR27_9BACT|nr:MULTISPECIES: dipeptide epimerase [Rufibacter]MBA9076858.1 L-alanine-DL-glutamate epimerase-like enolase superfamily enzyme [Rufibacter quisquiliarum]
MLIWHLETRELTLRYTWKISRNASDVKTNLFVTVGDGKVHGRGEAAPNVRYGETPELLNQQFSALQAGGLDQIGSVDELQQLMRQVEVLPALRFALESAFIHYVCRKSNQTVGQFLGVQPMTSVPTAYSYPIMDPARIAPFTQEHGLQRFEYLKVKVNQETGLDMMAEVARATSKPLMVDANEAWQDPDAMVVFMEKLRKYPVIMIEQPMPSALAEEYLYLKKHSPYDLFADESVTDHADWGLLKQQFHGVNMKLMKAGGYLNGLEILNKSRAAGLKTMIGCMMETSMGIWSAIQLAHGVDLLDLDGMLIVKEEPFALVKEQEGKLYPIEMP